MISKKAPVKSAAKSKIGHLIGYLLDQKGKSDRVAAVAVTNCCSDDPKWAVHEMQAVQSRNQRAKGDRTYHLVVSFRAGEDLHGATLAQIEDEFCRALGFAEHQRVSVVHRDTDNLHLHVAINKVHPERFTLHEPFNDYHTRAKLCQRLEQRYGLGSDVGKPKRDVPCHEKAAVMETVAGVESLIGYVQRSLKAAVASSRSWQEVHEAFAKAGVALKPRGNGLVVESNGKTAKASNCFRELSKAALEKRFGPYKEGDQGAKGTTPSKSYAARPMQKGGDLLYKEYQAARKAAREIQHKRIGEALAAHRRRVQHAKTAYKTQRTIIGLTRRGTVNTIMLQLHRANLKNKIAASFAAYQSERSSIYRGAKLLAWNDWLMAQAATGSKPALALLQARAAKPSPPPPAHPRSTRPISKPNARPDYHRSSAAKASINIRPDYFHLGIARAPLPSRPDYERRHSPGVGLIRRAVALLQSRLGKFGRRAPARPLASVRDVSSLDVVYDLPRTEVFLRAHEPDRLGSEVGSGSDSAMRRQRVGLVGAGREESEGGSQISKEGEPLKRVTSAPSKPYATRNGTLRGVVETAVKMINRAKGWTNSR